MDLKGKIGVAFKRDGLVIHGSNTFNFIIEQLKLHKDDHDFIVKLLKSIDRRSMKSLLWFVCVIFFFFFFPSKKGLEQNVVDLKAVENAVEVVTMDVRTKVEEESLKVIGAFDCPRFHYHDNRKTFLPDQKRPPLHGSADDQARMFRDRFEFLFQRLTRHSLFSSSNKLSTVKSLLGVTGERVVFGMLTRNSQGDLILEDLNNTIPINVDGAKIEEGIYTDHCLVLAEGKLVQGIFEVHSLAMPPVEEAEVTLSTFTNVDMFGGAPHILKEEINMYQNSAEHVMFVVLSDVWLDKPSVMAKLDTLFDGYKDIVPTAFIFTGNYTSKPFGKTAEDVTRLQNAFQGLFRLINKYKSLLLESKWIFSRGPGDGGGPLVFPQFPLADYFMSPLKKLPDVEFTTNPFRLRWCNRRIVVFRENLVSKMGRHSLFPKLLSNEEPAELLVKTIMEQGHLCPMPQPVCPLYWNYDQAMYLYPVPDLLVLADSYRQFIVKQEREYHAANPGSFSRDFSFLVIRPATMEVEESRVFDEDEEDVDNSGEPQEEDEEEEHEDEQYGEEIMVDHNEDKEASDEDEGVMDMDIGDEEEEQEEEIVDDDDLSIAKTQIVPDDPN